MIFTRLCNLSGYVWKKRKDALRLLQTGGLKTFLREARILLFQSMLGHDSFRSYFKSWRRSEGFDKVEALFVLGKSPSSIPYRIENPQRVFDNAGYKTRAVTAEFLSITPNLPSRLKLIWIHRGEFNKHLVERLQNQALNPVAVIFDNDDLTFDSEVYNPDKIPGLKALPTSDREKRLSIIPVQRSLISKATHLTASTPFLLSKMELLNQGAHSFLVTNCLTPELATKAKRLKFKVRQKRKSAEFSLVYASGSNTHQGDFAQAWPDLIAFLESNSETRLSIIGISPISEMDIPMSIRDRVKITNKLLSQTKLLAELAKYDLNLSPLDTSLQFNHAKSALKVIHAGAVGVRTIASLTDELEGTIQRLDAGRCVDIEGWASGLAEELDFHKKMIHDPLALQQRTLEFYGTEAFSREFSTTLQSIENWLRSKRAPIEGQ